MNEFKFQIEKKRIEGITAKIKLKKEISKYYSLAVPSYRSQNYDVYDLNLSLEILIMRHYCLNLYKIAKLKYINLGYEILELPVYAQNSNTIVKIKCTLEEAKEIMKYWKNKKKE